MKTIFDMLAIVSGMIGLGGLVFQGMPLTPENASLQSARAIVVVAFVVIPYFIARAIEKMEISTKNKRNAGFFLPRSTNKAEQIPLDTLFFDYFFKPVTSPDWQPPTAMDKPDRTSSDDLRGEE